MTEKTPEGLRAQRAHLIASTGLAEAVLRERAEAFQLYPEHMDVWRTVEGIDCLLDGAEQDMQLTESQAQARGWEEKYFEMVEKYTPIAVRDAALQDHLPVLRRAIEALPETCRYHADTSPRGGWRDEACCDTGIPARRRALAEKALGALSKTKEQI
ncbi:hypothetical protein [Streptomyces sp. NPDC005969]|uniref:hypothetical protein n=1 Tax=Streptomyces sp. NPDC005969 TaxID=3156722 RepID=UPI0033CB6CF3